jgi:tetratricopeptide (TPR) repeat protein
LGRNLRAAAEDLMEEGLRLQKAGKFRKALERFAEARERAADQAELARAWRLESFANHGIGEWADALAAAVRSEEIARRLEDGDLVAEALNARAAVHYARAEFPEAEKLYDGMLESATNPRVRGLALQNLGILHGRRDEPDLAEEHLNAAHACFEEAGYAWGQAHVLNNLVGLALDRCEFVEALKAAGPAIAVAREVDDLDLLAIATLNLAESLAGLGRLDEAEEQASTALGHFQTSGNLWRRIACLRLLGDLNEGHEDREVAERFWTSGLELADQIGAEKEAAELRERLDQRRSGP